MTIDHINVVVRDLEKAKQFFLDLGFVVKKQAKLEGAWIEKLVGLKNVKAEYLALGFPDKETNLELITYYSPEGESDESISLPNQLGFRHMAIAVEDIEKYYRKLKSMNVQFLSGIVDNQRGKKLCYFLGPEGIILELAEYNRIEN
jgi:catechol 2,3-dioxygenase-like lactoylglutathione lyase family enzyme